MIYLTRRERFSAAHRMFRPDWSDAKNMEIFGKCSNPKWHGHNYDLYVTVRGELSEGYGFVMNISKLKQIIIDNIIRKIDHKNINLEVDFLSGRIISTESLVKGIWDQLENPIRNLGVELHCIKLQETENNSVEYYGKHKS